MLSTSHNTSENQNTSTQETATSDVSSTRLITPEAQLTLAQNGSVLIALCVIAFIAREVRLIVQASRHIDS